MKIFIYKTFFVFICLFLFYKFTIDAKINEYEKKFELLQSDYGREIIREKVREEVRKSLKKQDMINARLFIKKHAELLYGLLPNNLTSQGKATGVRNILLDKFYEKTGKRKGGEKNHE